MSAYDPGHSSALAQDEFFMRLALEESFKALPRCVPNPPVGCVLVRDGEVVCRGFTHGPGGHHAEAHALSQFSGELHDVTAYVTLEPCSFSGRTPSCAVSLVQRKINTVVVSLVDPDPRNNGKGLELLSSAGIRVRTGVLADVVSAFIAPYLNLPSNRPPHQACGVNGDKTSTRC